MCSSRGTCSPASRKCATRPAPGTGRGHRARPDSPTAPRPTSGPTEIAEGHGFANELSGFTNVPAKLTTRGTRPVAIPGSEFGCSVGSGTGAVADAPLPVPDPTEVSPSRLGGLSTGERSQSIGCASPRLSILGRGQEIRGRDAMEVYQHVELAPE